MDISFGVPINGSGVIIGDVGIYIGAGRELGIGYICFSLRPSTTNQKRNNSEH